MKTKSFRVTWTVDIDATSHEEAARIAAQQYFQQRIADGEPDTACVFEVFDTDHADPVVVDLSEE